MVPSLVHNSHVSEVFFTPMPDIEESSDDSRTELDSNASMVILGSNTFVLESTGRNFNAQPFSSDLDKTRNFPLLIEL